MTHRYLLCTLPPFQALRVCDVNNVAGTLASGVPSCSSSFLALPCLSRCSVAEMSKHKFGASLCTSDLPSAPQQLVLFVLRFLAAILSSPVSAGIVSSSRLCWD